MIDKLVVAYGLRQHAVTNEDYRSDQAIGHRTLVNKSGERLYVVFPHWHAGQGTIYKRLIKNLSKDGSAVLAYGLNDHILQPDVKTVLASFDYIQQQVTKELQELTSKHRYKEIILVGMSLGNVSLAKVAESLPNFTSIILVVCGSNLARGMWEGVRTQSIRQAFEEQGLTEDKLDTIWQTIAPKHAAEAFRNKKVIMLVSTTDRMLPSRYQREMVDVISGVTNKVTVKYVKTGHAATLFRFCYKGTV